MMGVAPRPAHGACVGIDLGGTKIEAAVLDDQFNVLGAARRPTPTSGGPADVAAEMVSAAREACAAAGLESSKVNGIGVGSPGIVNASTGTVTSARNLPGWEGSFALGETLSNELGGLVLVGNDVQVATEAEYKLGAGRPYDSLLGVFWGTGVGGGIVLDGESWLGRGGAGEIGHVVVKADGARCPCGRRGCMEAYAGRLSLERRARKAVKQGVKTDLFKLMEQQGRPRLTSSIWARSLKQGDKLATKLIDRAVAAIAVAVGSAVNLLDVEAVIIGGGLGVRFGQPMADRIASEMLPHVFNDARPPDVRVAELGDLGGAIGASLLVHGHLAA